MSMIDRPRQLKRLTKATTLAVALTNTTLATTAVATDLASVSEAPTLAERFAAGSLPPVEERLPASPEVIEPLERVGSYGGAMRQALRGNADHNAMLRAVGAQGLVRWTEGFSGVVPNVAESFEVNEDASAYTFNLRPGMRWSDGHPFTADDILFFVEDLLPDTAFFQSPPSRYVVNGELMRAEKLDDHTVKVGFAGPYRTFLEELATSNITAAFLPPYSPELNAIERLWLYLKKRFFSHRLWPDYDAIVDAVCKAWQRVTSDTGRIKSLCSMEWAEEVRS